MVWSDKSVSEALDAYSSAIKQGVPDWYAMRLALDVAFEENNGVVKIKKENEYSSVYLAIIGGLSAALGIVILFVTLYSIKA